jgi:hypothetical protein
MEFRNLLSDGVYSGGRRLVLIGMNGLRSRLVVVVVLRCLLEASASEEWNPFPSIYVRRRVNRAHARYIRKSDVQS